MATPNTPLIVSQMSQKLFLKYTDAIFAKIGFDNSFRAKLLEQDRIYARELDWSAEHNRALLANRMGNPSKVQNVTIPVVGPQVDSATAYFIDMFLSSYPVFPVLAIEKPEFADAALQIETLLGESSIFFQWVRHLALCFRDGFKHNLHGAEITWVTENVPEIQTDPTDVTGPPKAQSKLFAGNKIKHLNLYNTIMDTRVPPTEVHTRGDFAGYCELITKNELKQLFLDLDHQFTMNATEAFQSGTAVSVTGDTNSTYYIPQVNPFALVNPQYAAFNWVLWGGADTKKKITYSDMYEKLVLYVRIIPREFAITTKIGPKNPGDPQIYKLIIINRKVVVFVQRQTNAHNYLPIVFGQMNEDSLGLQTKSYADNAAPYQFLASSLYNSGIHSQRRKVFDRLVYDPSRINKADIDKADPIARIPVRTEAYGKPIGEAIQILPYRDDGVSSILQIARDVVDMADVSTGSNRVQRGQFQKGNKTRGEFEEVMQNSDARPRASAVLLGASWFQPIKYMLKCNILQYQPPMALFNRKDQKQVNIQPADIRKLNWEFALADGIMPSSKFIDFELMTQILQYAGMNPAVAAEYDIMGMLAYQLKSKGATWVTQFKRTPEQTQQQVSLQQQVNAKPAEVPPQLPAPAAGA